MYCITQEKDKQDATSMLLKHERIPPNACTGNVIIHTVENSIPRCYHASASMGIDVTMTTLAVNAWPYIIYIW